MDVPSKPRLLVVDDEAALMHALCDTLRDRGYEVEGFTSGEDALAALQQDRFDVLLTDLMMPDLDGLELLRRALGIDSDLVGLIMTGQGTIGTAVEAMKSGALDYILKPFKLSAIMPVLSRALAVRRLRAENAELQRRVQQRTAQLEAANRELEAFSYSVSHDLRAPLRKLEAFSGILVSDFEEALPEEARSLLERITANARRMSQLVEDLLRFSRLSQQPVTRTLVDLQALVQEVTDELLREERNAHVSVQVGPLPERVADAALLRQAFSNLLSNAMKFSRHREDAKIEVGAEQQEDEYVFFVRDNGSGFDMKHAHKLFEVFQRLHSGGEVEGTGIGLSLVQRIIHRHGGRIWAYAEVDRGATFYFTLPPPDPAEVDGAPEE